MFSANHPHLFQVEQQAAVRGPGREILVRKRPDGTWDLPGGPLGIGRGWKESLSETVESQTGLVRLDLRGILEVDSRDEHGETFYTVVFECAIPEFEAHILRKEREDALWLVLADLHAFEFRSERIKQRLHRILAEVPLPH